MLTRWAQIINPVVDNDLVKGVAINGIQLNVGVDKVIQNPLQRVPIGFIITDLLSNATVWRTKAFNFNTLTLQGSANTTCNIWLY